MSANRIATYASIAMGDTTHQTHDIINGYLHIKTMPVPNLGANIRVDSYN